MLAISGAGWVSATPRIITNRVIAVAQVAGAQLRQGESVGVGAMPQEPMMEWALRQGGALAVLLVVLFFYRRDYRDLAQFWRDQHKVMADLVATNTKANTEMMTALRENTIVVHATKNVLADATNVIALHVPKARRSDG